MIKILFLAANPTDTVRLRVGEESRAIDAALRKSEFRDEFQIENHFAVRVGDLTELLLRYQPDIVHFSGHGTNQSEIILENDLGKSHTVSVQALSRLFSLLTDNIRCVILNACYSEEQAQAIAQHIDCVVGMSNAISDTASIKFATSFYLALGYGRDIQTAFDLGCAAIDLESESLDEQDIPQLLTVKSNPSEIILASHIQLPERDYLVDRREEIGSSSDTLLTQYLSLAAKAYAPLYFPLGHLSQPIPLSEVYVDLPIVKPPTDEAFLRPLRPGERWSGETIRRADQLLQRSEHAALVGILGTGKTTTLRYLTWLYAQKPQNKFYWRSQSIVPFYANIRDLAELWIKKERVNPERFVESLATASSINVGGAFPSRELGIVLQYELSKGNALVLLDALDEYKAGERVEFIRALQSLWLSSDLRNNHILLTSRPYGFLNPFGFGQYGLQELDNAEYLVFRLGRAILTGAHRDISEQEAETWLELLNQTISQPRFRELSSSLYLTLMVYLGTSEDTAEESVSLLNDIKRLHDPYRYFLYKTIEWEEQKDNKSGVEHGTALLVLAYTAYYIFVEPIEQRLMVERIASTLQIEPENIPSVQKFWQRTGLLWEDERRGKLGFRHAGFQAFGIALTLMDMILHSKAEKVSELWNRFQVDPEWNLIWQLFMSLRGEGAPKP